MSSTSTQGQCLCGPEERQRRVLMVRRLHPAVTMQMLLQTFGVFGSVTGCKVFTHKSGRSAGCASLEFSTHQAACAALKGLQGSLLHGKHVMLQWFDQTLSTAASPVVSRGPGQRAELPAGPLSEGGGSCAAIAARQLSSAGGNSAGPVRSTAASCPGLSPFGMFAAAPPNAHPFCNSTAAMAAAAAAAAAVAAQQQQHLHHPNDAAAATAAALLSGQHNLPPLVVQQLQRQVSAPLGPYSQLSPTGAHIPPSPLTPGSHGGGWEALMSPGGHACGQQQQQQQQRGSNLSSRGGAGCEQQQGWGAAAKLSAAMSAGGASALQDNLNMAASLQQQLATMQQQALAYAAWQNQQQAAAALLQHQFSGQLPASPMLSSQASAQHVQHLLGARSMPSELGNSLSADFFLQQATASLQQAQQQQQQHASDAGGRETRSSAGAAGSLGRQHSTPVGAGLLAPDASASPGGVLLQQGAAGSSAGGADSIPAAGAGSSLDQAAGGARVRSPGSARRKSTGALGGGEGSDSKAGADGQHTAKKHLQWEDQRQSAGDHGVRATGSSGEGCGGSPSKAAGGGGVAEGGRASGRSSSHQLMAPLRGYSGSDDTANVSPDVNAQLASAQAAAAAAAAAAVSSCYLSSPTWLSSQRQGLGVPQVTPELLATLQGPSLGSSQNLQRSPSTAGLMQQQQSLLLAAAAAAAMGSPGSSGGGFASSSFGQLQQQQARPGLAASRSREQLERVSDRQLLMGGGCSGDDSSSGSNAQPGMLFNASSQQGRSAVSAALDAMSVSAAMACAQGWQQQKQQQQLGAADGSLAAAAAAEAPSSEAFKHKHKMQLRLPTADSAGAAAAAASKASLQPAGSRAARDGLAEQLITTEVLPESPAAAQQQRPAAHSPFGAAAGAAGPGVDPGSTWADWSASMAALLSPAHVSSLASRRFEDLLTLQHGMAHEAAAAAQGQAARTQQQQQHSTPGLLEGAGTLSSTSSQAAWLQQQQKQQSSTSSFAPVASMPGSLLTSAGSDVFGAAAGESMSEGGAGALLGKTRHNSLCLDSRPGLLTLSHMFQEAAAQQGAAARASPRGPRASSPQQQLQQQALARRALAGEAGDGGGGTAATGFGSFTFQPPVLRSGLPASGLSAAASSNNSNLMICQPFQLPDFFSRESRASCPSPRGRLSAPGGGGGGADSTTSTAGAGGRGAGECVGSPLHPSGMQHQFSENLNGLCIAEESFSGALDGTDRAPGSPVGARHLQHSFSMPARFSAAGGPGDALAAAMAAGAAGSQQQQQEGGQQQGERQAAQAEAFRTLWGLNAGSAGSLRG